MRACHGRENVCTCIHAVFVWENDLLVVYRRPLKFVRQYWATSQIVIFALLLTWQLYEDASLQLVQVFLLTLRLLLSQGVYCRSELIALPPAQTSLVVIRCGIFVVVLADVYGFVFPSLIIKRGRGIYWASLSSSCLCLCVCVICWFYFLIFQDYIFS